MIILDRDGLLNINSKDKNSPYYYILKKEDLHLRPGVLDAMQLLEGEDVLLATRQRCIEKKLISLSEVEAINEHLCELLGFRFKQMYIQPLGDNKLSTFEKIQSEHPGQHTLIDDSPIECESARHIGFEAYCSDDLYATLKRIRKVSKFDT